MRRIVAGVLAAVLGGNGLAMLFAGLWWYGAVPGVTATGPYNPHFVRDIGAAYLVTGLAAAWFAWKPRQGWPALVAGARSAEHTSELQSLMRNSSAVFCLHKKT